MSDRIADTIKAALDGGTALLLTEEEVIAAAPPTGAFGRVLTVTIDRHVASLVSLTPILAEAPIGALVEGALVFLGELLAKAGTTMKLDSVTFVIAPSGNRIHSLSLAISFAGAPDLPIGNSKLVAEAITLNLAFPGAGGSLSGLLRGSVALGEGRKLVATIALPRGLLSLNLDSAGGPVAIGDLLAQFGIGAAAEAARTLKSSSLLASLAIEEFEFSLSLVDFALYTSVVLKVLGDGQSSSMFRIEGGSLSAEYDSGTISAAIGAAVRLIGKLHVDALFSCTVASAAELSDGRLSWTMAATLSVPETARALALNAAEARDGISLKHILSEFGVTAPAEVVDFDKIKLTGFSLNGTYADGAKDASYSIEVGTEVDWTVTGEAASKVATTIVIDRRTSGAKSTTEVSLSAEVEIKGFKVDIEATYSTAAANGQWTIAMSILGGDLRGIYAKRKLAISIGQGVKVAPLIGQFVGLFSKNRNVELSAPWNFLNDLSIGGTTLTLDFSGAHVAAGVDFKLQPPVTFVGVTVKDLRLDYEAGKGVAFHIDADFPGLQTKPSWNPMEPANAPQLPGMGAKLIDVKLIAAGQKIEISPKALKSVPFALKELKKLVHAADGPPEAMPTFSASAGWLLGADLLIREQVAVQFVFVDPVFYGARLVVGSPPPNGGVSYLKPLENLSAEILYRRINDTVGVYEGKLTLPKSVADMDFKTFKLHLPSISADIYTDGEFLVDVGFPHGGDFAQSASIVAGKYFGAGGAYLGRLAGSNVPELPKLKGDVQGFFGTTTELGFGLKLGVAYGFSSGPLTADLGVTLTAIFEGLFAELSLTRAAGGSTGLQRYEYYRVHASVSIVGTLVGKVDLAIIDLSLLIVIELSAAVTAVALKKISVPMKASLEIDLKATINLGLFKITKEFYCDYELAYTATFGDDASYSPWIDTDPASRPALVIGPIQSLETHFRPLPDPKTEIRLYTLPVLTRSRDGGQPYWCYTVQLALDTTSSAGNFAAFADYAFAWFVRAYCRASSVAAGAAPVGELEASLDVRVTAAALRGMQRSMQDQGRNGNVPSEKDLKEFFGANFRFVRRDPGQSMSLTAFPTLPKLAVTISGDGKALEGASANDGVVVAMLRDYLHLVTLAYVGRALEAFRSGDEIKTLRDVSAFIWKDGGAQIHGTGSRFLLHGSRLHQGRGKLGRPPQGGDRAVPLYRATGQQYRIDPNWTSIAIGLKCTSADWPISSLDTVQNIDPRAIFSGADIRRFPTSPYESADLSAGLLPFLTKVPRAIALKPGAAAARGANKVAQLRPLPRGFLEELSRRSQPVNARLVDAVGARVVSYAWCTEVRFRVRAASSPKGSPPPYYAIVGVRAADVERLAAVVRTRSRWQEAELAWREGDHLTTIPAGSDDVFIYPENLSTQREPPAGQFGYRLAGRDELAKTLFPGRLLASGLTNRGGFYLYVKNGLPKSAFGPEGTADLSLLMELGDRNLVYPFTSGVKLGLPAPADTLYLVSDELHEHQPTLAPGMVGMTLSNGIRPALKLDAPRGGVDYQATLDDLFGLVGFAPIIKNRRGDPIADYSEFPLVAGPLANAQPATGARTVFTQALDLYAQTYSARHPSCLLVYRDNSLPKDFKLSTLLESHYDPYQFVGYTIGAEHHQWVDYYGNALDMQAGTLSRQPIPWVDPIGTLSNWPGLKSGYFVHRSRILRQTKIFIEMSWRMPSDMDGERRLACALAYARLYHQLSHVNVELTTSLLDKESRVASAEGNASSVANALRDNIKKIVRALDEGRDSADLEQLSFRLPQKHWNHDNLYPLSASLVFRLEKGTPAPSDAPIASFTAVSELKPWLVSRSDTTNERTHAYLSLAEFAEQLEAAFPQAGVKLMVGETAGTAPPNLWILRYSEPGTRSQEPEDVDPESEGTNRIDGGVRITVSPWGQNQTGRGYAPIPLGAQLFSRADISPEPLETEIMAQDTSPDRIKLKDAISVQGFDVDLQMRSFMEALDRALDPQFAIPAQNAASHAIETILSAKRKLAESLAAHVKSVSTSEQTPKEATEAYCQAILKDARSYYGIDAVALYKMELRPSLGRRLLIYGHLVQQGDRQDGVSISPAACPIESGDQGTFAAALSTHRKGLIESYGMPEALRIAAIQIDLHDVAIDVTGQGTPTNYTLGTWLHFVRPPHNDIAVGSHTVSMPMRSQPALPSLIRQSHAPSNGSGDDALSSVKRWDLTASYRHHHVAQDVVAATFRINDHSVTSNRRAHGVDLLAALALYDALASKIADGLDALRNNFAPPPEAVHAIKAFAAACKLVADSASKLPTAIRYLRSAAGWEFTFEVAEGPRDSNRPMESDWIAVARCVGGDGVTADNLEIQIPGFTTVRLSHQDGATTYGFRKTGEGARLARMEDIAGVPDRAVALVGALDIVGAQSGLVQLIVERNRYVALEKSLEFNKSFQLCSPHMTFTSALLPMLTSDAPIDISQLPGLSGEGKLRKFLATFIQQLSTTRHRDKRIGIFLQVTAWCESPTGSALENLPPMRAPMGLVLHQDKQLPTNAEAADVQPIVDMLVIAVRDWAASNRSFSPRDLFWKASSLVLQVSVFSTAGSRTPSLVLDNVRLPFGRVQEIG